MDEHDLEPFWQAARDHAPTASPDFMARVTGDALRVQQGFASPRAVGVWARLGGLMQDLSHHWLPMGGMVAVACTGVAIGLSSGSHLSGAQAITIELMPTGSLFSVATQGASVSGVN